MSKILGKEDINTNLESLRGFSAFLVIIHHCIFFYNYLDPSYNPVYLIPFEPQGHLFVLVFFVLSGYVIGISNRSKLTLSTVKEYLFKRFVRLYPIYFVSIIFTLIIAEKEYSVITKLFNFLILQVALSPVIQENVPIWSLHYEVVYYLLFVVISLLNLSPIKVCCLSLILGILNILLIPQNVLISSYLLGFTFWTSGLIIAHNFKSTSSKNINFIKLIAFIFLLLSLQNFNVIDTILNKFNYLVFDNKLNYNLLSNTIGTNEKEKAIPFSDLAYLPYCFVGILIFLNKDFKYKKVIVLLLFLLPSYTLIFLYKNLENNAILIKCIGSLTYYFISIILFFFKSDKLNKLSRRIINIGIILGSISYGIYIIHMPILYLFKIIPLPSGTIYSFVIRVLLFILITIIIGYFLDKKFQPWIRNILMNRNRKLNQS